MRKKRRQTFRFVSANTSADIYPHRFSRSLSLLVILPGLPTQQSPLKHELQVARIQHNPTFNSSDNELDYGNGNTPVSKSQLLNLSRPGHAFPPSPPAWHIMHGASAIGSQTRNSFLSCCHTTHPARRVFHVCEHFFHQPQVPPLWSASRVRSPTVLLILLSLEYPEMGSTRQHFPAISGWCSLKQDLPITGIHRCHWRCLNALPQASLTGPT